ncbi:MAG: hypothetical protein ACP5N7_00450 [Candidatus Pacearchaeota archaeon]
MKIGLPLALFNLIKAKGEITYDEMEAKTKELGYKVDTGTRKMRLLTEKSKKHPNPLVKVVKNGKAIIGYRYIGSSTGILKPKPIQDRLVGLNLPLQTQYKSHYDN